MIIMKILFFIPKKLEPSGRFRVLQYIPYLEDRGFKCTVQTFEIFRFPKLPFLNFKGGKIFNTKLSKLITHFSLFPQLFRVKRAVNYDVIFLQRTLLGFLKWPILEKAFHRYNRNIIFDFDDSIFRTPERENLFREIKVRKIIKLSKYVIVGNKFLKEWVNNDKKTFIIPTVIDTKRFRPKSDYSTSGKTIVGWTGTSSNFIYLQEIRSVLQKLSERQDVEIRVISNERKISGLENIPINYVLWKEATEVKDLQQFDIGIMPLLNNTWTKGKCGFKLIQYMAIGIPFVCSPVGANLGIVNEGVNGFFAKNEKEWLEHLTYLIEHPEKRLSMGLEARKKAVREYSVLENIDKLEKVLRLCAQ